jgi:hypothetical protein
LKAIQAMQSPRGTFSVGSTLPMPSYGSSRVNPRGAFAYSGNGVFAPPNPGAANGGLGGVTGIPQTPATSTPNPYAMVPTREPVMSAISRYGAGVQNQAPQMGATPYNIFSNPAPTASPMAGAGGSPVDNPIAGMGINSLTNAPQGFPRAVQGYGQPIGGTFGTRPGGGAFGR